MTPEAYQHLTTQAENVLEQLNQLLEQARQQGLRTMMRAGADGLYIDLYQDRPVMTLHILPPAEPQ